MMWVKLTPRQERLFWIDVLAFIVYGAIFGTGLFLMIVYADRIGQLHWGLRLVIAPVGALLLITLMNVVPYLLFSRLRAAVDAEKGNV